MRVCSLNLIRSIQEIAPKSILEIGIVYCDTLRPLKWDNMHKAHGYVGGLMYSVHRDSKDFWRLKDTLYTSNIGKVPECELNTVISNWMLPRLGREPTLLLANPDTYYAIKSLGGPNCIFEECIDPATFSWTHVSNKLDTLDSYYKRNGWTRSTTGTAVDDAWDWLRIVAQSEGLGKYTKTDCAIGGIPRFASTGIVIEA